MNYFDAIDIKRISSPAKIHNLPELHESIQYISSDRYKMEMKEIRLNEIHIGIKRYRSEKEQVIRVDSNADCVISHFCFSGASKTETSSNNFVMKDREFGIFYKKDQTINHIIPPTEKEGYFFQMSVPKTYFQNFYCEESPFMNFFCNEMEKNENICTNNLLITPIFVSLINEIANSKYIGKLNKLYLEAKIAELFIKQITAYDNFKGAGMLNSNRDRDLINEVRVFLEENPDTNLSIPELARMVGINQTKLKSGFKDIFGKTIFTHLTDIRMETAKRLLLDEKKFINEVSDIVGYKHPHHFSAAFKRKFGFLPRELKQ